MRICTNQFCGTEPDISCLQEQADIVAHFSRQRQLCLMQTSLTAFISNRHLQAAKRQASQQAAELRSQLLLKTVMLAWHSHLQVACNL